MITTAKRKKIAKLVLTTDDDSVIEKIGEMLAHVKKVKESYIKKYNKEIAESVKQIKSGKYYTQEEADSLLSFV